MQEISKDCLEAFFGEHAIIMLLIEPESGNIVEANRAAVRFYGYSYETIISMNIRDINILTPEEVDKRRHEALINNRNYFIFEHKKKNTDIRIVEVHSSPVIFEKKHHLLSIIVDITEKTQALKKLEKMNDELNITIQNEIEKSIKQEHILFEQRKFADMGQMISAVAHQWRQPLNALGLYIQDIEDQFIYQILSKETLKESVSSCMSLIKDMSRTIDDFRTFFSMTEDSGDFEVIHTIIDIIKLINAELSENNIQFNISCKCADKSYSCKNFFDFPECLCKGTKFFGKKSDFKQAIINIIHNAIEAIEEKKYDGFDTLGNIEFGIESTLKEIIIYITDNGCGIDKETASHIFTPYFTTKHNKNSTGLGLYITKLIVEKQMDGKISYQTSDNGTTFIVSLPIYGACYD